MDNNLFNISIIKKMNILLYLYKILNGMGLFPEFVFSGGMELSPTSTVFVKFFNEFATTKQSLKGRT